MKWLGWTVVSLLVFLLLAGMGLIFPIDLLIAVALGWAFYLYRVIPQVHISGNGAATGVICLVGFALGLHAFLSWFVRSSRKDPADDSSSPWQTRWTAATVVITLLMFVAGMAAAGFVHQAGWLITSPGPLIEGSGGARSAARRAQSTNNLKLIGLALRAQLDKDGRFAPGCTVDRNGETLHSWMTLVLPFMEKQELFDRINLEFPWNDPTNAPVFREQVLAYLHTGYSDQPQLNHDGFAFSNYTANVRVMGGTQRLAEADIKDGASRTILAGEVADRFPAWGQPGNWRDPALGVNRRGDGFGGPSPDGANFLFVDGSVRFLKNSTSLQVLKALSTPAGGEPTNADQY